MSGERIFVRCYLTVVVAIVCLFFTPIMLILKLAEGLHVSWRISSESVRQVWAAKGIPEFDRLTKE